ncbi:MAG: TIM barrel protein [Candidatus Aenigmarchaeota archaeon]|nr:TIM barrel protein [Candidatus Aenigmarchaeota archaeon]
MKFKVKLGPAGIPLNCNGSSIDAIEYIKKEGLQAMEVEFVRGVKMSNKTAQILGERAKQFDIELSIHAPYYINLASEKREVIVQSKKRILDSMERAYHMGAKIVVVHAGYYGKYTPEQCHKIMLKQFKDIVERAKRRKWKVNVGIETMAKPKSYGKINEVLDICSKIKQCAPVIDFGHMFAYNQGKIDYEEILDKVKKYSHLHSHFSNMRKNKKGEYVDIHKPIDHEPPFKPLAQAILKRKVDITIISESPILDIDSLKMKRIFEKLGYKFT